LPFDWADDLLCAPSLRRAFPETSPDNDEVNAVIREAGDRRNEACCRV
jgi:hypothetical protein